VSHVLKEDTVTIGRMAGNTVVINDASVSLMHAKITRKNGLFFLKDLNSTNGTFVNGQAIVEAQLRDLDELRFADVTGSFCAEATVAGRVSAPCAPATPASPAQPVASPVPPATAARQKAPWTLALLITRAVPIAGGAVALAIISFLTWRLATQGREARDSEAHSAPPATVRAKDANEPSVQSRSGLPSTPAPATNHSGRADLELPQLVKVLKDPDPAARREAVAALHSLGPDAASANPALHEALGDPDEEVRFWAALTLINNKSYDKAMPPILVGVLHDEKPMIRQLACLSLGLLPYEPSERQTVVPALVAAASNDSDQEVREAAVSALEVIDPDATAKVSLK
jgi:hypothetical protein